MKVISLVLCSVASEGHPLLSAQLTHHHNTLTCFTISFHSLWSLCISRLICCHIIYYVDHSFALYER